MADDDDNSANVEPIQAQLQGVNVKPTWCDRLRPRTLDECMLHEEVTEQLRALVLDDKARNEFPHIMLTGPSGSGKRTRASCLIAALYKIRRSELYKIFDLLPDKKTEQNSFAATLDDMLERINFTVIDGDEQLLTEDEQQDDSRSVPVNVVLTRAKTITCDKAKDGIQVLHSPVHVEMTPHDVNFCDTKIVQSTLKTLFESNEFDLLTFGAIPSLCRFNSDIQTDKDKEKKKKEEEDEHTNPKFRIFVFNNVDKMSREAQTALRRIMEDYSAMVRFILIAVNVDHVCAPIQSRCHLVTVPRPKDDDVRKVLRSALNRVLPQEIVTSQAFLNVVNPYLAKLTKQAEGNMTKALTVLHASLHSLIDNHDAIVNCMSRLEIAQPDWILSVNECVRQICQVSMRSSTTRHVFVKDTLCELLKRRVPTEHIVRHLDTHVRRTLFEQCGLVTVSVEQLLQESSSDIEDRINDEEGRFLQKKLYTIKCQLAGVCSDISTLCAFYETRSTKSQYAVIHINALALSLIVIVGLYQNNLAISLGADSKLRVCRPYSLVYDLSRLLRHTMQKDVAVDTESLRLLVAEQKKIDNNTAEQSTVAQQMKQMCLTANTLAGVDWKIVVANAKNQKINVEKVLK